MIEWEVAVIAWDQLLSHVSRNNGDADKSDLTLEDALAEIQSLKREIYERFLAAHIIILYQMQKPARGRRRYPFVYKKENNRFEIARRGQPKVLSPLGRPRIMNTESMIAEVQAFENFKRLLPIKNDVLLTDKALTTLMIDHSLKNKSAHQRREEARRWLKRLKYMRDCTGIRQRRKRITRI